MISEGKFIFRRTILDIPLLVFLASQVISTVLSIDPQTSILGYYSRFNGGLISTICYLVLYWAFVSNVDRNGVKKLINITLISAAIVSLYGVLERLGIDKNVWQQTVQLRVFSTLGQPNWLAAWLVATIPITWVLAINNIGSKITFKSIIPHALSLLFFIVLLFTGSRSGLLGFGVVGIIFWGFIFLKYRFKYFKMFVTINAIIAGTIAIFGTQLTPSIFKLIENGWSAKQESTVQTGATALETGGTESGAIRKIVWQGALKVWKHYPIFGTGVETFAYSYYLYRPVEHNLTSEWDYIYNKAHNEYLNFMANSGTVGIFTYLTTIGFSIYLMARNFIYKKEEPDEASPLMSIALIAGYISILVTNFFGFSVVPIQLQFYLYPAFAVVLSVPVLLENGVKLQLTSNQKALNWVITLTSMFLIFTICRYWFADTLYTKGVNYDRINRQDLSPQYLNDAIKLQPNQSLYYSELSRAYTSLALAYNEAKEATVASQLTAAAIDNSAKAVSLSPTNVNLKRVEFGVFVMLSTIDQNYLINAKDVLVATIAQAPTDAKLHYNLGLIYSRIGQNDLAIDALKETVEMKPDYKDARLAYAILLIGKGQNSEAKVQLEYILANIDPTDSMTKQYLESI
jgi:O-antigen ligase